MIAKATEAPRLGETIYRRAGPQLSITGFRCMLQAYIDLCHGSPVTLYSLYSLYSYTAIQLYTLYSIQVE